TAVGWSSVKWQGRTDTLRGMLGRLPRDATYGAAEGSVAFHRAQLFLYERAADSLLQMPEMARPSLAGSEQVFSPSALYAAWAHQLRGDQAAARVAFDSARVQLDSWLRVHPDDWRAHGERGLALAGPRRRAAGLREARCVG